MLQGLERQWKLGDSLIGDHGPRREAFNIILSMPRGTDPLIVQRAVSDFARIELADLRCMMVLHSAASGRMLINSPDSAW
ncbi:MAG: hypothetical protein ABIV63_10400 [Caldimonas sp.]